MRFSRHGFAMAAVLFARIREAEPHIPARSGVCWCGGGVMRARSCGTGLIFLALGAGLLLSLLIPGWFARVVIGVVLIGIGCLAGCCD